MYSQNSRPKWWQLYLALPLLIVLFMLENRLKISARGHQFVQIGILVIVYGLVHVWLKANSIALSKMDQEHYHTTFTVREVLPDPTQESLDMEHSTLQFPDAEIHGVLSDTFEFDYVEAAFPRKAEVSQKTDKE